MALQLRRGTNAERLSMTPLIGELIFVTDYDLATLSVTAINATTDTLTSVAHGLAVNQQIKFQDANLNGLVLNQVYFVKTVPSSDTFTLSLTLAGATVNITGTFSIPLIFATSPTDAAGAPLGTNSTPLWVGDGVTVGGVVAASLSLDDLVDVDLTSLAEGNTFYYDATTGFWRNTNIINVNDATNNVTLLGDLAVNGGAITTTQTTGNLFNATATTVNAFGASTATNIGSFASGTTNIGFKASIANDLTVNNGTVLTNSGNVFLFNAVATTIDAFGAATAINIGDISGAMTIRNPTVVGTQTTQNLYNTVATTLNIGGAATATNIGSTASGTTTIGRDLSVLNDLFVTDSITVDNQAQIQSSTLTTTSTATVALNTATRNAMTGLINIVQGTNAHCVNFTAVKTGASTAMLTTYAEMYDNISLGSFSADVSGSFLRLLVTPSSATSTVFSVVRTSLT